MKFFRRISDISTFMQLPKAQRRIVFYSEGKAYWVHLEGTLKQFLECTTIPVCYISSGTDDPGLSYQHPRLRSFQIDEGWLRNWFFANVDTDVMVMTMPDLQQYQIKRSKNPVHYVYIHHSLVSHHMVYRPGAFDYYDTIFCAGPHHAAELRAMEAHYHLPQKNLIAHGYGRLDAILRQRELNAEINRQDHTQILIAPSWGPQGLIETVGAEVVTLLLKEGYKVTLRPHPQTVKFANDKLQLICETHKGNSLFTLETDMSSQQSLHQSAVMISDWSGAALDYAFGLEKPVIFIDTPRKINNPDYQAIPVTPFEVFIREKIGTVLPLTELNSLPQAVKTITSQSSWQSILSDLRTKHTFNVLTSHQAGAAALQELLV